MSVFFQSGTIFARPKQSMVAWAARASVLCTAFAVSLTASSANAFTGFESVFDCGDVIGKVFDDKNRNGVQDAAEPGLPGVRLAGASGLLTVTDEYGRYHITCAELPRNGVGSNFLMKVDSRSLPLGYRITSKNPRVVRLTDGKVRKLNFGAVAGRVVRLDLAGAAFKNGSTDLDPQWSAGIEQLITVLDKEPSVLRMTYEKGAEDKALANARMQAVSQLVDARWQRQDRDYPLEIERRMRIGR